MLVLYGSGWYDGQLVKDTISFAGMTIEQQEFLSADDIADIFGYMRFDGIIGLAQPALSITNVNPDVSKLWSSAVK
ncbi:Inositol hexakisphosphate and diphosphoinositol-pentakisphosphate kinase [Parelaphostrongylus tenuis]|uniref:Inositol hexakisphosphate and diphosphoinositol-pentakisphosphate kinase n=1 Tax=Parelaphostrongylus tenuis TaxID=148309 RepID=A0AAD5N4B7_PARTN|nr:Inositol hexakisphosphate and diphosphoinositol-pentakisphosphate kinase [Parelaphostrongylus tenuis]